MQLHDLVEGELAYRQSTALGSLLLAFDCDVIFQYLMPGTAKTGNDTALEPARLVDAVLESETFQFTLFPAALTELSEVLRMLSNMPVSVSLQTPEQSTSGDAVEQLSGLMVRARAATFGARRAAKLLRAKNLVDARDAFHNPHLLDPDPEFVDECFRQLRGSRGEARSRASYIDSINLGVLANVARARLPISYVTVSPIVRRTFTEVATNVRLDAPPRALLTPRFALLRLALARASAGQIDTLLNNMRLVDHAIAEYKAHLTEHGATTLADVPLSGLLTAEQRLSAAIHQLIDLHVAVAEAWSPLVESMPREVDVGSLRLLVQDALDEARRELQSVARSMRDILAHASDVIAPLTKAAPHTQEQSLAQRAASRDPSDIYVVHNGGMVDKRIIYQHAGGDINAVIDSYNTAVTAADGTTANELRQLILAVEASSLNDEDKKLIISEALGVGGDVAREGKLTGRAKLAWAGIKAMIGSVPAAVTAWDALAKLWK